MAKEKQIEKLVGEVDAIVDLREREVSALESIAHSLDALAMKFAPPPSPMMVPGILSRAISCPKGHGMSPTDDYCQVCEREKNPRSAA